MVGGIELTYHTVKKVTIVAWAVSVILAFVVGLIIAYPTVKIRNLSEEYETARVIQAVGGFVLDHGEWPKGWDDLDLMPHWQNNTRVNWNVNVSTADRFEIMQAIQPKTGFYMTYPHAEDDLQCLYDQIIEMRKAGDINQAEVVTKAEMTKIIITQIIVPEFSVENAPLEEAIKILNDESEKAAKQIGFEPIRFTSHEYISKHKVTLVTRNTSMMDICSVLAQQGPMFMSFDDSEVAFVPPGDEIE